jgi:hypothetical protein
MTKRNIFSELVEGFEALKSEREGKLAQRQVKVQAKPNAQAALLIRMVARMKKRTQ